MGLPTISTLAFLRSICIIPIIINLKKYKINSEKRPVGIIVPMSVWVVDRLKICSSHLKTSQGQELNRQF